MKTAVYPGSFDPVTFGHLDILGRAASIFDEVLVVVSQNTQKHLTYWFDAEERLALMQRVTAHLPNVRAELSSMLLAAYCAEKGDVVIVKGLRAMSDFESEFQMALVNRKLNPRLDTLFLTTSEQNQYLSSGVVREVARYGGDISPFVPAEIIPDILKKTQEVL